MSFPIEEVELRKGCLSFIAALAIFFLAIYIAFRISDNHAKSAWAKAAASQAPARASPPAGTVFKIPLSTFKRIDGLRVGVRMQAATANGQKFFGTVTSIGKEEVTVETLENSEGGASAQARPPRMSRHVPLSTFKNIDGLRVGVRIQAATANGRKFFGTVTSIGKEEVTVEVESP